MSDWIECGASSQHIRREREKARQLRQSPWWKEQLRRGICHYCGKEVGAGNLTMDHVIPVARGGKSVRSNCVPCCKECNNEKRAQTPAEMILEKIFSGGENEN